MAISKKIKTTNVGKDEGLGRNFHILVGGKAN
jgi:hypothetical protein